MGMLPASAGWILLSRPVWLGAIALAAVPLLVSLWARRRGRLVSVAAISVQCLAVAMAALALAGPRATLTGKARLPYLLLSDASGSVRGQVRRANDLNFPPGATVEQFYFAEGLSRTPAAPAPGPGQDGQADATRIAPALQMIASRGPESIAAAVIATDGRFTDTDWQGPAAAVAKSGIELLIVPMDARVADGRIVALDAARRTGTTVEIAVTVSTNTAQQRVLTVTRSGRKEPLAVRELALLDDSPATIRLSDAVAEDAAAEYRARLDGSDAIPENDSAAALVLPLRQRLAAVAFDGRRRRLLSGVTLPVDHLPAAEMPTSAADLAGYSGVLLLDPTGTALSAAQRRALGEYVHAGGGLVMIGTGPNQTPADENDPLNRVLPLLANPFQRRPLHLRVVLDRSGSMARSTAARPDAPARIKFDRAAEAVVALKEHLTPRDALTVITFAGGAKVEYESGAAGADFAALREALRKVRPAGSTKVVPALKIALEAPNPPLGVRRPLDRPPGAGRTPMVLVVSDLQTQDKRFDPAEWAEAFRRAGASLAVVAIGEKPPPKPRNGATTHPEAPPPLERLAELLKAPYVRRDQLTGLARIFATMVRRGRGSIVRRAAARVVPTGPLFGAAPTALPDVDAYLLTAPRPQAEVLARAEAPGGEAILARMQAGLGRTVCLALPMGPGDNAAWQGDPRAARLISAAAAWAARRGNDPRFDASLDRRGRNLRITVTASQDGTPLNGLRLTAAASAGRAAAGAEPAEASTALVVAVRDLVQTAPGRYEASVPCPPELPAAVAVRDESGATLWHVSAAALYPREYHRLGADRENLTRLAELTGGKIVSAQELPDALGEFRRARMTDLWPWLIGAALALMLTEWALTRVTRR